MAKIGVGVITCDRLDFFKECMRCIPDGVGEIVVVNDGKEKIVDDSIHKKANHIIEHPESVSRGVGRSKNEAMRWLVKENCDLIFLIEDDMRILNPNIFEEYIRGAEGSGIWHLNFAGATPFNRHQETSSVDVSNRHLLNNKSPLNPRLVYECENGSEIALYRHLAGCFSFFHKNIIREVGYHDERYYNAFEHVDHTYRIIKKGLHPHFWWFADIWNSSEYIEEIEDSIKKSVIAKDKQQWNKNLNFSSAIFAHTHGMAPNQIPDTPIEDVKSRLEFLSKNYSRKILQ